MTLKPGAKVHVRLYDARLVAGTICVGGIFQTSLGTSIRLRSGHAVYLVKPDQITRVVRGGVR